MKVIIFCLSVCLGMTLAKLSTKNESHQRPIVIFPEEWEAISHNSKCPDLLVGYLSSDTLYLRFDN